MLEDLDFEESEEEVFLNVTCDGCGQSPIVGIRYKCCACGNYDLCLKCHKHGYHSEHAMLKIRNLYQEPTEFML